MKEKTLVLFLFLIFITIGHELKAQSLVVRLHDGTENIELLNTLQKLTFSPNDLLLAFKSGSTDIYGLSAIQKLYFDTGTGTGETSLSEEKTLSVFPNPARNTITVGNIGNGKGVMSIFRSDGALVLQQEINNDTETIEIKGLKSGLYFIITNGRSAKFIRL